MSTLYEYYNTNWDAGISLWSIYWRAQTFTPVTAHKTTSVKLRLYRVGTPGTLTVSIRATDGSGHPTGGDLCSGTIDGSNLTTSTSGAWYEITLGDGYDLSASTKYAIVARAPSGSNSSNAVYWLRDSVDSTYGGGNFESSSNGGSSWTIYADSDLMFEEWGEPSITPKTSSDIGSGTDAKADYPAVSHNRADTGSGIDDKSSGNPLAVLVGADESGAGIEVVVSLLQIDNELVSSDSGAGVDEFIGIVVAHISLDAGQGTESVGGLLAQLIAAESGIGVDAASFTVIPRIFNRYLIELRDAGGSLLGVFKDVLSASLEEGINTSKILSLSVPASDFRLNSIGGQCELWVRDLKTDTVLAKTILKRREDRHK